MPRVPAITSSLFGHPNNICLGAPRYVVCCTPPLSRRSDAQYSPQQPILEYPQPTFLPPCERPSFTPIQNNKKNYRSARIKL